MGQGAGQVLVLVMVAVQSQKAVTAYFSIEQLLPISFADQCVSQQTRDVEPTLG